MSNTATTTILVPIGLLLVQGNSEHMILIALTLALSASCALFLPVSTPPNAIAFSTGLLEQKDFRKGGLFFGLLGPISAILWGLFLASFGLAN
jgi:sodium-dependent dicarboxylate transporter 2/3/5